MLPDRGTLSCLYLCLCQQNVYRHVGVQLRLKKDSCQFSYPSAYGSCATQAVHDMKKLVKDKVLWVLRLPCQLCFNSKKIMANHSCSTYIGRLQASEGRLMTVTLEGLYEKAWRGEL